MSRSWRGVGSVAGSFELGQQADRAGVRYRDMLDPVSGSRLRRLQESLEIERVQDSVRDQEDLRVGGDQCGGRLHQRLIQGNRSPAR